MTNHVAYDAAYPLPAGLAGTDTVLIYMGGDTPHVWTPAEIAAQPERYRLPVWVRSYGGVSPQIDGNAAAAWLRSFNVPAGAAVVLDLEGLIDPTYVDGFGATLHAHGYKVLPYGEGSTLFSNPELDGYYLAEPNATEIDPRCVATQYGYFGSYDLSWIAESVTLWDKEAQVPPAPAPPPPTPIQLGGTVLCVPIPNGITTNAAGWMAVDLALPTGKTKDDVVGITMDWASAYDGQGWQSCAASVDFTAQNPEPNVIRLVFQSSNPNQFFTGRVFVAD